MDIKIGNNIIPKIQPVRNDRIRKNAPVRETSQSFDKVLIENDSRKKAEKSIAGRLQKEAVTRVFSKKNDMERIKALKQQVQDGSYKVDPDRLAAKILMMEG